MSQLFKKKDKVLKEKVKKRKKNLVKWKLKRLKISIKILGKILV